MSRDLHKRLGALEQRAQVSKGMRIFQQDLHDASAFFEGEGGLPWSRDDIHELSAQGWTCIVIEYTTKWRFDSDNEGGLYEADN